VAPALYPLSFSSQFASPSLFFALSSASFHSPVSVVLGAAFSKNRNRIALGVVTAIAAAKVKVCIVNAYNGVYDCYEYPSPSPFSRCNRRFDPMTQRTSPKSRGNARIDFILDPDSPCPHLPPFLSSISLSFCGVTSALSYSIPLFPFPIRVEGIPPPLTLINYINANINILLFCMLHGHLMKQRDMRHCSVDKQLRYFSDIVQ